MIILEVESAILRNLLERFLDPNERLSGDYWFCDFDGVRFHVRIPKTAKKGEQAILVEVMIGCAAQLDEYGAVEHYDQLYGRFKVPPSADDMRKIIYTHAIKFNLVLMPEDEQKAMITLAARLKANLFAAPFLWVAKQVRSKSTFAAFEIPYRGATGESLFLTPTESGAACTFAIRFNDPGDKIIGSVFFQELQTARTRVPAGPLVTWTNVLPSDFETIATPHRGDAASIFVYVTVSLQSAQLSERKCQDTAYYVPMLRDYVHYHIKCAKAVMHQKMRHRVALMLKTLDDAKPAPKVRVRRTAQGKVIG